MSALNYEFPVRSTRMEGKNSYCVVKCVINEQCNRCVSTFVTFVRRRGVGRQQKETLLVNEEYRYLLSLWRAIAVFSTFELICSSFRVGKLFPTHTIFFSNMTSSREEKKTYADAVKRSASPLRNTWWRRLQEQDEEEAIFIAMKRSVEELKVVSQFGKALWTHV